MYYLKNPEKADSSVYAIFSYRGKRYKLYPGIKVRVQFWDQVRQRAKRNKQYPEGDVVNEMLQDYTDRVYDIFSQYDRQGAPPTADALRFALKHPGGAPLGFLDYFEQHYCQAEHYRLETRKGYRTTLGWLKKYEAATRQRLTFHDINIAFYDRFIALMRAATYTPRAGAAPQHYSDNYIGTCIKHLKHVMRATGPDSLQPLHNLIDYKHFSISAETADSVYLTLDELHRIHAYRPTLAEVARLNTDARTQNAAARLSSINLVRNKFLIGAFTALRVSDFNRLREVNIKKNTIVIKPKKGTRKNEDVIIPIHPIVAEILNTGFDISTPLSDQKLNKHIKEICEAVGINEVVSVTRTEGGQLVEREFKKSQLVSTHTARRSGATNMYLAGIPAISIMKITGHKTERNFLKYIRISAEENARLLSDHPFFK